ncbi:MAG: HEPN domain-containing protein [Planctomycetia bacterium]|nr:HEPN domain-containing protein [Planctomycetia bacterium]
MSADPRVAAFLRIAAEDLGAAQTLVEAFPRQAISLAQQAVEKIARAILAREKVAFGTSHNIGQMAAALPGDHPWRPRLAAFDNLSPAATSYRYPTPGGRIVSAPTPTEIKADLAEIAHLLEEAKRAVREPSTDRR